MRSSVALDTSAMIHLAIRKQPNVFLPSQTLILQRSQNGKTNSVEAWLVWCCLQALCHLACAPGNAGTALLSMRLMSSCQSGPAISTIRR